MRSRKKTFPRNFEIRRDRFAAPRSSPGLCVALPGPAAPRSGKGEHAVADCWRRSSNAMPSKPLRLCFCLALGSASAYTLTPLLRPAQCAAATRYAACRMQVRASAHSSKCKNARHFFGSRELFCIFFSRVLAKASRPDRLLVYSSRFPSEPVRMTRRLATSNLSRWRRPLSLRR